MNWSNGQLARHARRRYNTEETKQKQYFAQARRQKPIEPQKQKYNAADFVPSYLQDLPEESKRTSRDGTSRRESRRRILTLQEEPDTTQLALKPPGYECTPEKIKRQNEISERNDTNMDAKRRRLLEQSDWSGVELQKPVIIEYPDTARSVKRFQRRMIHDPETLPVAKVTKNHISANTVIKIANQEYRWSPGNNSIRTYQSNRCSAVPGTPLATEARLYNIPSSASKSFSSFAPESPCADRALQVARNRMKETQLQSVSHTSPSVNDEPLVKAGATVQYFHPQPIRHMPQSIYTRLANSAHDNESEFKFDGASRLVSQGDASSYVPVIATEPGESFAFETANEDNSQKISICSRESNETGVSNRQSLLDVDLVMPTPRQPPPQSIEVVSERELAKVSDCLPRSITTPDIYRLTEGWQPGKRLSALPYKGLVQAPECSNDNENNMWKRFVLGPDHIDAAESAASGSSDTLDIKGTDSRRKLGVKTSALEAPTRIASRLENKSPAHGTRRRESPTPAPTGPTPPLTISADGTDSANKLKVTNEDETPVYFREQRGGVEAMAAFPAEAKDEPHFTLSEKQHMTTKPESKFQLPSLFVGRLAASAASAPVAVPKASEPAQDIPVPNTASARVMSRRRRNKRREVGRPDIRALPNIRGDPIEFTP
ncbi:hypothetical protein PWT90_04950 [Aphanocladium album]|nr:hypothetical protein PWT90_04950 [Aphanocladium album]